MATDGISLAMVAGVGLGTVARVIHAYPTQAEAIKSYNPAQPPPSAWINATAAVCRSD